MFIRKSENDKFILITTSLIANDFEIRKIQYIRGIQSIIDKVNNEYKICIIENTGINHTDKFLENFNVPVLYTNNNLISTDNKGIKELKDIQDAIEYFKIKDNDFIIKMTGRYYFDSNDFFNILNKNADLEGIIRFGSYNESPQMNKMNDCITGLIGMKCKHVKTIKMPKEKECVEWKWAEKASEIEDSKLYILSKLGLWICPGSNSYFLV